MTFIIAAFGLGTMIYNGMELGTFFEIPWTSPCYQVLRGINPILQMIFTFSQMYFVFMNARVSKYIMVFCCKKISDLRPLQVTWSKIEICGKYLNFPQFTNSNKKSFRGISSLGSNVCTLSQLVCLISHTSLNYKAETF